jgi:hypothetical protein
LEFLKEVFVISDLLRGVCDAEGNFFDDAWFDKNVNFNGRGDVVQVPLFKGIVCGDWIIELIHMYWGDEIFSFNCIDLRV